MMARYIDADKLLKNLKKQYGEDLGWQCTINMSDVGMMIEDAPTADVVEEKHGEWELTKTEFGWNGCEYPAEYTCSVCGRVEARKEPYCHCGAKMDGGGNK